MEDMELSGERGLITSCSPDERDHFIQDIILSMNKRLYLCPCQYHGDSNERRDRVYIVQIVLERK